MNNFNAADVIIIGAGPVGLTLANLLGLYGVRTVVIERNATLEPEPRAVTLDDESLRTFQNAGLINSVLKDVVMGYGVQYFDWNGKPFASIQPTRQEYGYPKRNAFRQPALVSTLAEGLKRFVNVEVLFGHECISIDQSAEATHCTVITPTGETHVLNGKWLVACDGGRSKVRDLCNIPMKGESYSERWLIVDLCERTVPLRHTRTYCDPRRPAIRLPGPSGIVRYEFMLRSNDQDEETLKEGTFRSWIAKRMPEDADLPLVRKAIYGFHALVANRWKDGRVLLAGDAAHLTPPFAGQGLNSGIRDAANLAWKLAAATRWGASPTLLDTYEQERRPHASALIRMALRIGTFMQPKSIAGAIAAQWALRAACLIPACRDYILQLRFKPKPHLQSGFFKPTLKLPHAELLPQPLVQHPKYGLVPLDTQLGEGFSIVGWDTPDFRANAANLLPNGMPGRVVALIHRDEDFVGDNRSPEHICVRDVTGELGSLLDRCGAAAMVIRPDRYSYEAIDQQQLSQK
ncbi:2-polyprenyl-6-methoxyphenol hydroxylase-like oxidoreductase [Pseudomonas sp. GM33]|uniref:bifunctional 3-(3-hydroxy-phenyl)propionate/3-hydroxycinnamic acid hydroxylase n=1 Tax=Pseudomonas sp. GM33 TaxID=1144329 RepID=UPI00026FF1E2|nr:bifunctional 3-(3-hydroxy-phenyl)propionate/3-hydroxycinnamic acid hydroxylase [Pseudomonas sp. GM33]EJM34480.1 2-polyprenyl-6-methoxyphenol hydroxylase-like oxidoreductase [Pseudomonas sp. GM33]